LSSGLSRLIRAVFGATGTGCSGAGDWPTSEEMYRKGMETTKYYATLVYHPLKTLKPF
jgi:hypothetical protein